MSTGSRSVTSTAATGTPAAVRTAAARSGAASGPSGGASPARPRRCSAGCRRGPTPTARRETDVEHASTRCSIPTGVTGPVGTGDHVHEPTFDPEPTLLVEVADVAGAMPARRRRAAPLGGPQPVVVVLDVGGGHADLAGHTGRSTSAPVGGRPRRAGRARCVTPGRGRPTQTPFGARSGVGEGLLDLGQRDVGGGQGLGHAVRGVQLGAAAAAPGSARSSAHRDGRAGGQQGPDTAEPAAQLRGEVRGRGGDVAQRGGGGEDDGGADGGDGLGQCGRGEGAGLGRIHVRYGRGGTREPARRARTGGRPRPDGRRDGGRRPCGPGRAGPGAGGGGRPRPWPGRWPRR